MNFLVDAQLPPALCRWLREHGHEAIHVVDIMAADAPDVMIADYAERQSLILISKDQDFPCLRLPDRFGLLWIRCGNATTPALFECLVPRWTEIERLLASGERMIEVR